MLAKWLMLRTVENTILDIKYNDRAAGLNIDTSGTGLDAEDAIRSMCANVHGVMKRIFDLYDDCPSE